MSKMRKLLVIDDDHIFLKITKIRLSKKFKDRLEIHTAIDLIEIEERMMNDDYDFYFIDINMPETTGWEVVKKYKEKLKNPSCTAFICSSSIDPEDKKRAEENSDVIEKMLSKPIDPEFIGKLIG